MGQGSIMHICLVSHEYPPETADGGIGTQTWNKAHGLSRLGHSESYRVSRRPHFLGGWGLWDVQVGFRRRCASVPSG